MTDILRNIDEVKRWRTQHPDKTIGFVPTMGALHDGHLALVDAAQAHCDLVVVSIFVNPTQFGADEDFDAYPRIFGEDFDLLSSKGVDLLFMPDSHNVYPEHFHSVVEVEKLPDVLCGATRPGHFRGVTTVVSILLNILRPDYSFFGDKDAQQLLIIQRMHADLHLSGEIVGVPIVRDEDGLALSSRNRNLSEGHRAAAPVIYQTLQWIKAEETNQSISNLLELGKERILSAGADSIDYLEVRDERDLSLIQDGDSFAHARLFAAVHFGTTRLIDNIRLKG